MNKELQMMIKKAASSFRCPKRNDLGYVSDELFLWVAKEYSKKKGYLPKEWAEYINRRIKEREEGNESNTD